MLDELALIFLCKTMYLVIYNITNDVISIILYSYVDDIDCIINTTSGNDCADSI